MLQDGSRREQMDSHVVRGDPGGPCTPTWPHAPGCLRSDGGWRGFQGSALLCTALTRALGRKSRVQSPSAAGLCKVNPDAKFPLKMPTRKLDTRFKVLSLVTAAVTLILLFWAGALPALCCD